MGHEGLKTCGLCKETKPVEEFYLRSGKGSRPHARVAWCKPCFRVNRSQAGRDRNAANRIRCITHYGPSCQCCGESELAFLVLDHVNGGGYQHRLSLAGPSGKPVSSTQIYRWVIDQGFPPGMFQTLCANCNTAKERVGGCPHNKASVSRETGNQKINEENHE